MAKENLDITEDQELGYGQILSVLVRRSGWIIGALAISSLWAAYNSLQKEPTYMSSMQLLIEPNYREQAGAARANTEGNMLIQNAPLEIDYATQIRVLQGSELIERAVGLLQYDYPNITVDDIRSRLSVLRVTTVESANANDESETNILQVDYTSNDPEKTQRVVKALQEVYLDYNLEQQELRLQNGLAFIDQQLPVVEQDVFRAEQSLEQFRESQNLIDPETRAGELAASLVRIEQERQQVKAEFEELKARYAVLEGQLKRTPQGALISSRLSESARYQNLLNSYQETELAIAEQRVQFTDESSYMRRLQQQLENQKSLLGQEVERILGRSAIPEEQLFLEGQFGETDLALVRELGQVQAAISGLTARDQGLAQGEQQIRGELARYPGLIAQFTRLQPEIEIKRDTLQQLLRARQEISIDIARGGLNWQVVETAQPGFRTGPNVKTDILLGSIAGLFLGVLLAFGREAMDNKLRTAEQIRQQTMVPLLGSVPYLPQGKTKFLPIGRLTGSSQANSLMTLQTLGWPPFRNSLDFIYNNIQLAHADQDSKSIAITSALPKEGKSTLAIGLALNAARLCKRVLLIDGNLRNPTLHQQLDISNQQGLSSFLNREDSQPLIQQVKLFDCEIDVLTSGSPFPDPVRFIRSQLMQEMIKNFEKEYDLVVVDSSAVIDNVDALQVATICEDTLLVASLNKITKDDLNQALSLLSHTNLIGIVTSGNKKNKTKKNVYTTDASPDLYTVRNVDEVVAKHFEASEARELS
jgi:polysaccharide biosynthesis transport protein